MKLHHILPLINLSVVSVFISNQSQAASEIRPCVNETCTSETARISLARAFGIAEGNGVHKLFYFNTETQALHSYRIVSEYDYETKRSFVRATAYNSPEEFKDYVKAVYRFESGIFDELDLADPGVVIRRGSLGNELYRGVHYGYFNLPGAGLNLPQFGTSAWGSILNGAIMGALSDRSGISIHSLGAELNQSIVQIQMRAAAQAQIEGDIKVVSAQLSGNMSQQTTYNVLSPIVSVAFADGFVKMVWNPTRQKFEIDEVMDSEGNVFKVNPDGSLSADGVPRQVYISDSNRTILEIVAVRFNLTVLKSALNSGRTGTVTICEGGPCVSNK